MFTGIIEATGCISEITPKGGDRLIKIESSTLDMGDVKLGDSIAVNGVCLTVISFDEHSFTADVSSETLKRSTFESIELNTSVNLEKAMAVGDRLGGHLVSGHVDGIGQVINKEKDARSWRFTIRSPKNIAHYIAEKGSITIDGISLTVNGVNHCDFDVNIVPHTMQETTMGDFNPGTRVNLEVDIIARYLERLISKDKIEPVEASDITEALLKSSGFMK